MLAVMAYWFRVSSSINIELPMHPFKFHGANLKSNWIIFDLSPYRILNSRTRRWSHRLLPSPGKYE